MAGPYPTLTTAFAAPPECSSHWTWRKFEASDDDTTTIWHDYAADPATTLCYPNPGGGWSNTDDVGTYSPGVCPSGATTAGVWWDAETTTAVCCQSGYAYTGESYGCTRTYSTSSTVTIVDSAENGDDMTTFTSVVGPGEAVMFAVAVMYQPRDIDDFPSSVAPVLFPSAAASAGSTIGGGPAATGGSEPSGDKTSPSSLSSGAKAAIGIGTVLGVLLLIACASVFFLMRKNKKKLEAREHEWQVHMREMMSSMKPGQQVWQPPVELDVGHQPELDGRQHVEMNGSNPFEPHKDLDLNEQEREQTGNTTRYT